MPKSKRLRIFAGPNGSGKSTLFSSFNENYNPGYFINADEIEKQLKTSGLIDLKSIGIIVTASDLDKFKKTKEAKSLIAKAATDGHGINIEVKQNFLVDKAKDTHSYEASFIASFIRAQLYASGKSFSFETVMSHPSKIDELKKAQTLGYRTYLYFVCTDSPEINVDRIANRVTIGGHGVGDDKVRSRYAATLKNLYKAIKYADRVFLFDNSKEMQMIAELSNGALSLKTNHLPEWFQEYVLVHYS
jgi:predicted ABC-type ATPase